MTCFWLCDFEAYKSDSGQFIVREISILKSDGTECYSYMVKSPKNCYYTPYNNQTMHYQFKRHKIRWEAGDHSFKDAMDDIRKKVEDRSVYVKGFEKVQFLQNELWLVHNLQFIPSFKKLNNCYSN